MFSGSKLNPMSRTKRTFSPRYRPAQDRYDRMEYRRCGRSGLKLPAISLGLWHNFGGDTPHELKRDLCCAAFDHGITHFDLANNYGPPPGSAEIAFGEILATDFAGLRGAGGKECKSSVRDRFIRVRCRRRG